MAVAVTGKPSAESAQPPTPLGNDSEISHFHAERLDCQGPLRSRGRCHSTEFESGLTFGEAG
jgi:hypothetical protein